MKPRRLTLSILLSMLLAAASALAQINSTQQSTSAGECSRPAVPADVIAVGPPVLTRPAADCALDVIAFMASQVKGVKRMDIDPAMREKWRAYLAASYPSLSPSDQVWFASAPDTMTALHADWPHLPWLSRLQVRQRWAAAMPAILHFMAPVVLSSQFAASRQSLAWQLGDMIRQQQLAEAYQQQQQAAAAGAQDRNLQQDLYNNHARSITLQTGMQSMANDTITLMHSYSSH